MKAMILAAGRGERLRPITDTVPKPLIEIGGKTMLERAVENLKNAGVFSFVINTWHLADKIEKFLEEKRYFGADFTVSREEYLLDTGGGLKKASEYFKGEKKFFVYNCDILCDFDLNKMKKEFDNKPCLGLLAVKKRPASRKFIFDEKNRLCGWVNEKTGERKDKRPAKQEKFMPFCGIQLLSNDIFAFFPEKEKFSLTELYLDIAERGGEILSFEYEEGIWHDIGDEKKLAAARRSLEKRA
ncbi:MAG: nucleotidyltransferase family protein [Elusimicrobia bacterium]|nr:nucleotidyltransferase family protein [Elusimicrobiota bacterium]